MGESVPVTAVPRNNDTATFFFDASSQSGNFINFVVICCVSGLFLGADKEYKLEYVVSVPAVVKLNGILEFYNLKGNLVTTEFGFQKW